MFWSLGLTMQVSLLLFSIFDFFSHFFFFFFFFLASGKTTAVKRLIGEEVSKTSPTLGFDIHTITLSPSASSSSESDQTPEQQHQQQNYTAHIWDIGGQTTIRAYWKNYFEETDGVIWVVDSNDTQRLLACANELKMLLASERLLGATLLVLANKQDVVSCSILSSSLNEQSSFSLSLKQPFLLNDPFFSLSLSGRCLICPRNRREIGTYRKKSPPLQSCWLFCLYFF